MATTAKDWEDIIIHRLNHLKDSQNRERPLMHGLLIRHGLDKVDQAISERASYIDWPDGCGISGSDVNHITNDVVTRLGEPSIFTTE